MFFYTYVMRVPSRSFAAATLLLFAGVAATAQQAPPPDSAALSPLKILLTMTRTYASCTSYRDTGKAKTRTVMEDSSFGSDVPFATAFVRGGAFRFQFTDSGLGEAQSLCIIFWDGTEVQSWWDAKPGIRYAESLQQALDAASGISTGASLRVPGMLLPTVVGSRPPLVDPERIADAPLGAVQCYRVVGKSRATPYTETAGASTVTVTDEKVTLWIDQATYLLRKIEEARTLDSYRSTRTTVYTPEINVAIPADQLQLNAPGGASPTRSPDTAPGLR
jgi:hypothetical protein